MNTFEREDDRTNNELEAEYLAIEGRDITIPVVAYHCTNCGNFCPSGTLDSGLCNDCALIGTRIMVSWRGLGMYSCLVTRVSRTGQVYAKRWIKSRKDWSAERPIRYHKGWKLNGWE